LSANPQNKGIIQYAKKLMDLCDSIAYFGRRVTSYKEAEDINANFKKIEIDFSLLV
jgi:hypothetical protein